MEGDFGSVISQGAAYWMGAARDSSPLSLQALSERTTVNLIGAIEESSSGRVVTDAQLAAFDRFAADGGVADGIRTQMFLDEYGPAINSTSYQRGLDSSMFLETGALTVYAEYARLVSDR